MILLLCAACGDDVGFTFPINDNPGGNGANASGVQDAAIVLRGRVCVIDTLTTTTITCATTGADNLIVNLGDQTATTTADGNFVITTPPVGTNLSFQVSGPNVITTSQTLTARAQINVIRQTTFDQMVTVNGVTVPVNTGSIIATITRAGVGVSGVTATSTPSPAAGPFFAGSEPMPWSINATGASGIVWFPGVNAGPADLSFFTGTGGEAIVGGVQVINGGITMVETPLP